MPVLGFTSLRGPALAVVAGALDDDEFRARVRVGAPGDAASVLFLERPDGWQAAVRELARLEREVVALRATEPDTRRLEKRLEAAESARSAAEAESAVELDAATAARDALAAERERRRRAEAAIDDQARSLEERAAALDEQTQAAERLRADLEASHRQVRALRSAAAQDESADVEAIRAALGDVRTAVDGARSAIDAVEARLEHAERRVPRPPAPERAPSATGQARSPVPVPPGLVAESADAARHLVRVPGIVVLVDGYNVTIGRWGEHLGITDQRQRLEQAASSAAARTGAEVWIVFDGADVARSAGTPRSLVRVRFSESGEEADDVIIRLVREIPPERPVVVVSDDNRVRRGAVAGGANLFTVEQFLGVCGVDP